MRHSFRTSAVLSSSTLLALPAFAQTSPPSIVVSFSTYVPSIATTPVPVGSWGIALAALAIGASVIAARHQGARTLLGLAAITMAAGWGLSQPQGTWAEPVQRTIALTTSPTTITLQSNAAERVLVRNDTVQALRLDGIALDGGNGSYRIAAANSDSDTPHCSTNQVIEPEQACVIEVEQSDHFLLQEGDVVQVRLNELHPTQPSVGYDQIYYHLARKQPDLTRYDPNSSNHKRQRERTELKRASDYCEDTGRNSAVDASYVVGAVSLINGTGFTCKVANEADAIQASKLKTVVVGPGGQLYLTDGHHTFTTLWELNDGGPDLPVWVRVAANFSDAPNAAAFWSRMAANQYVWLFDANGQAIEPSQLPSHLGLDALADDPYRSLVYLTRDMGYNNKNVQEFAEFYWGRWLREIIDLNDYTLSDLSPAGVIVTNAEETTDGSTTSYVAAVRDAALAMRAIPADTEIAPGVSASQLGQLRIDLQDSSIDNPTTTDDWETLFKEEIWQDDQDPSKDNRYQNGGKAWYANGYRACGAPADDTSQCWATHFIVNHPQ